MAHNRHSLAAHDPGLSGEDEEPLDVLDLPQLYTRPSAKTLLATLDDLTLQPASWDALPRSSTPRGASGATTPIRRKRRIKSAGVPHYLTRIIASPLAWIDDDAERERIWESASQRLSERSGRRALGALTRTFAIPLHPSRAEDTEEAEEDVLAITLHEPALTADNLGLKTWAAAYMLAKRLPLLLLPRPSPLHLLLPPLAPDARVLELGAGTGLVGIAAAAVLQRTVVLTDLPAILPNLTRNVRAHAGVLAARGGGRAETAVLDWSEPAAFIDPCVDHHGAASPHYPPRMFPLILAADPIYSPGQPALLVRAIDYHLSRDRGARVVLEIPLREGEGFAGERRELRVRMAGLGLGVVGKPTS
ncbi:Protein-lysine N-methyltransferase rrg1 [Teratosphaeriaceae sp. CCFEE 6253]|nr:Protein-lysine N-methyltransferase rrg1 [Teratosphaeriaceae sp. CCFEE 6253]